MWKICSCELKGGRDHTKKGGKTGGSIPRETGWHFHRNAEEEIPQKRETADI